MNDRKDAGKKKRKETRLIVTPFSATVVAAGHSFVTDTSGPSGKKERGWHTHPGGGDASEGKGRKRAASGCTCVSAGVITQRVPQKTRKGEKAFLLSDVKSQPPTKTLQRGQQSLTSQGQTAELFGAAVGVARPPRTAAASSGETRRDRCLRPQLSQGAAAGGTTA